MKARLVRRWRLALLGALILTGLSLAIAQPVEVTTLLDWGARLGAHPLAMIAKVALMAALFTLALPGSLCLWLIAPFHSPLIATLLMLAGSVSGALGAYTFAGRLGRDWRPGATGEKITQVMAKRGDFLTQCALRTFPGFPHSIVNYAAGVLRIPLASFLGAALLGLSIKWGIYSNAIHGAVEAIQADRAFQAGTLIPLAALTLLLLAGALVKRKLVGARGRHS